MTSVLGVSSHWAGPEVIEPARSILEDVVAGENVLYIIEPVGIPVGGGGGGGGVSDHGQLTGLADDDHPQYTTTSELNAAITAHAGAADPHAVYVTASELATTIAAHEAGADPHAGYLTQAEGDARYVQPAALDPLATDADLAAHVAAADPHPQYTTAAEAAAAATAAVAAHEAAVDPHPTYLTQADGDARYYTEGEVDALLAGKAAASHTHAIADVTGLQTALDALPRLAATTRAASYTLALADGGTAVEFTAATAVNCTVPPNSAVAFPIGTVIEIVQYGAGQVTVVADTGVTVRTAASMTTRAQYSVLSLRKRAADEWVLSGDMT